MTSSAESSRARTAAAMRRAGQVWRASICRGTILRAMHVSSVNLAAAPTKLRIGLAQRRDGHRQAPGERARRDRPARPGRRPIASKKHHGGPDQAVYVYGEHDYAWWSEQLGRPLEPGTFGENLTVREPRNRRTRSSATACTSAPRSCSR